MKNLKFGLRNVFLSFFLILVPGLSLAETNSVIQKIAALVKTKVSTKSAYEMQQLMKKQMIHLRLMNKDGGWRHKKLKEKEAILIPNDMGPAKVAQFIDQIASASAQNDYLLNFLNSAKDQNFQTLFEKVKAQGDKVFPELVAYAIVLNRLTEELRYNWELMEICKDTWARARSSEHLWEKIKDREGFFKYQFEVAKLNGVEPVLSSYIEFHKRNKVDPSFMRWSLPKNIYMAVALDETNRNHSNALAGSILAEFVPYNAYFTEEKGDVNRSHQRSAVAVSIYNGEQWADLYQTWNMAFVTDFPSFPFVMTKLLIPQVANHYGHSSDYLYARVIALNAQLNYSLLGKLDGDSFVPNTMDWRDDKLTELWGEANLESAYQYSKAVFNDFF